MELERYLDLYKKHTIWEQMVILALYVPIDHMQHLTMNLEHKMFRLIITDRYIVLQKKYLILEKPGKSRLISNVFSYRFKS